MKHILLTLVLALVVMTGEAQVDSVEVRKPPVLSDLPIIFDRKEVADELSAMEKPEMKAQPVTVEPVSMDTRLGEQPGLRLRIPEVTIADVQRTWSRDLRKDGDGKLQREGNTLFMEDVHMEEVSSDFFNAEMHFDQDSTAVFADIAMSTDSVAMTPEINAALFKAMENVLKERGKEAYREKVEQDVDQERKVLDGMERELDGLVKDNEKNHKRISDNNIAINQTNMEIDQNEIELRAMSKELVERRAAVSSAADKEMRKSAKKSESNVEKARKKLQKDREKMFQNIIDYKREIAESEQAIVKNLESQKDLVISTHRQTLVIEAMKDKLESIR